MKRRKIKIKSTFSDLDRSDLLNLSPDSNIRYTFYTHEEYDT